MPSITSTMPVARFKVFADALFAKTAAILAQRSVNAIHKSSTNQSGFPPMAKCEAAPVKAVNAMINTLVPTAVLSVIAIDQNTGKCSDIYRSRFEFYMN